MGNHHAEEDLDEFEKQEKARLDAMSPERRAMADDLYALCGHFTYTCGVVVVPDFLMRDFINKWK